MKKNEEAAAKRKPKTSAAQIRVQKGWYIYTMGNCSLLIAVLWHLDLTELDLPSTMKLHHPDATNLLNFELTITPDEGLILNKSFGDEDLCLIGEKACIGVPRFNSLSLSIPIILMNLQR